MDKLPQEWVERIFERLECIFKEKWVERYGDPKRKSLYVTQWCSGLAGLTAEEIRRAITMLECSAHGNLPPTVIDFYHYAKRMKFPPKRKEPIFTNPSSRESARRHMDEIKMKLSMNCST